jgi:peptidoglycan-associated lipoprotein
MKLRSLGRWATGAAVLMTLGVAGCKTDEPPTSSGTETGSEFREERVAPTRSDMGEQDGELRTVYFDFNRYNIRSDARSVLRANGKAINNNDDWGRITLQGYCDERGSEEYNLALGERRANAVRQYMIDLGVPGKRLLTVSFGEARPAVMGHDESAWRYNRRVEFVKAR